jgi:hypothetical protein
VPIWATSGTAAEAVVAQHVRVVDSLQTKYPDAAAHLDEARDDLLAAACSARRRDGWSTSTPVTARR